MKSIIDPLTNKIHSIYSKKGRRILRKFINTLKGGMNEKQTEEEEDRRNKYSNVMKKKKINL